MASYDFSAPRLFVDAPLAGGQILPLDKTQHNYLCNVLRLSEGGVVHIFNGRDGEWRTTLVPVSRKAMTLQIESCMRPQTAKGDLHYLFAPLKHARLDYMVQKAVEMGASRLVPVGTRRTQNARVNIERMRANAIEAAEQCGILVVPDIDELVSFDTMLANWPAERTLVFCDEDAEGRSLAPLQHIDTGRPLAVLIGPEGGFDPTERATLLALPNVVRLSLGPRVLRADTAAVAALALVQAVLGDWAG
jgi:16S rRNA (uracil1498-N3)-methyltransferase